MTLWTDAPWWKVVDRTALRNEAELAAREPRLAILEGEYWADGADVGLDLFQHSFDKHGCLVHRDDAEDGRTLRGRLLRALNVFASPGFAALSPSAFYATSTTAEITSALEMMARSSNDRLALILGDLDRVSPVNSTEVTWILDIVRRARISVVVSSRARLRGISGANVTRIRMTAFTRKEVVDAVAHAPRLRLGENEVDEKLNALFGMQATIAPAVAYATLKSIEATR